MEPDLTFCWTTLQFFCRSPLHRDPRYIHVLVPFKWLRGLHFVTQCCLSEHSLKGRLSFGLLWPGLKANVFIALENSHAWMQVKSRPSQRRGKYGANSTHFHTVSLKGRHGMQSLKLKPCLLPHLHTPGQSLPEVGVTVRLSGLKSYINCRTQPCHFSPGKPWGE